MLVADQRPPAVSHTLQMPFSYEHWTDPVCGDTSLTAIHHATQTKNPRSTNGYRCSKGHTFQMISRQLERAKNLLTKALKTQKRSSWQPLCYSEEENDSARLRLPSMYRGADGSCLYEPIRKLVIAGM